MSGNSSQNEIKDGVGPGSQVNMSCALERTDGSKLCQKNESQKTDSSNTQSFLSSSAKRRGNRKEKGIDVIVKSGQVLGVSPGQWSSREQQQNSQVTTVNCNSGGCGDGCSNGKQEETKLLLQSNINTSTTEKKSDSFVSVFNHMRNIVCPDFEEEQLIEESSGHVPKIQEVGTLPLDVNKQRSVTDEVEGYQWVKNSQETDHHTEQSLMEHETYFDDKFVGTGSSGEAFSNTGYKADIQNRLCAQLEESEVSGVLLVPPADSLSNTSTGKCDCNCQLQPSKCIFFFLFLIRD